MRVLYEDNHIIIVNKQPGEIVQGDKTGDVPLSETVKAYLKTKYDKPGNVFLGVTHRLDRPTSGIVLFAKTSKALTRLNSMFSRGQIRKTYHAIVSRMADTGATTLTHWLTRNEQQNKSYVVAANEADKHIKKAVLEYQVIAQSDNYYLLQIKLHTGRHHQIRCQLAHIGCPIKGDLKYGFARSNADGSICLHARQISFIHPVSKKNICIVAPTPQDNLWQAFTEKVASTTQ